MGVFRSILSLPSVVTVSLAVFGRATLQYRLLCNLFGPVTRVAALSLAWLSASVALSPYQDRSGVLAVSGQPY